ncbi:MAG: ROK family protein, partial [Muribaculaceae bacterium]|nr:ROK family protein [Muribaculaceae bacterium]
MTKPYVLGVDIGGTNTVFGIVDARGHVIASDSIKTKKHAEFDDYVNELHSAVERLLRLNDAEDKIQGIGIGAPNANYYTGEIVNPPNLPWGPVIPLAEKVSEAFGGIPVAVTNDANAAALGEMTYGAARGMNDFIMITLGTGVGSGIVINGRMVYGHDGNAGELGHLVMKRNNGRMCGCGRTGCLEAYCSATGVARTAREFLEIRQEPSVLRNIDIEDITSKDVYDAAMAGDKIAKDIFEYTGKILGEAFADMVAFSSPQAIILFGGLAKSGDLLLKLGEDDLGLAAEDGHDGLVESFLK